jgi:4-nitrophenyl phosphatase
MAYKGYFFDLDGVAYMGDEVIPTCRDFVNQLIDTGIQVCFLTNNSSRTPEMVANHLVDLGYRIDESNVITSSQVTVNYLKQFTKKRVYLIGMKGLYQSLTEHGFEVVNTNADYVIVGLDRELTYEKLEQASYELFKGATFISTNSDLRLLTTKGIAPGNGSITCILELTTGIKPIYMGKPEVEMFEYGLKLFNLAKSEVVMVGDNYHTDLLGASNFGIDSIFVETGVMTKAEIKQFPHQPTYIVKDLSEFIIK